MSNSGSSRPSDPVTPHPPFRVADLRTSSQFTSSRASHSSTLITEHKKESVDSRVKNDMAELEQNVSVDTWVSAVCSVDPHKLADWANIIKEKCWVHDPTIRAALESFCNVTRETDRYVPLSNLIMRLLELAQDASGSALGISGPPPFDDILFYHNDPNLMRKPDEQGAPVASRKPDILAIRKEEKKNVSKSEKLGVEWNKTLLYLELKYDSGSRASLSTRLSEKLKGTGQVNVR
jgi:hypothetical protein